MVKAINFLFSTLHTTPFLYGKIYFGVLHKFCEDVMKSTTPCGSKPPHLQKEAFKFGVYVRGPVAIELFCFLIFYLIRYGDTAVRS